MVLTFSIASIGMFLLKLLLLILILGTIILVHEFGHFIWAKKFGVHIYEFSIGMGPLLFTHKGKKDKIDYNFRALPIGGYVSMAGEVYEDDDKIKKDKLLCNKPWHQRIIIMVAGVCNNFIMAILILMVFGAIWGGTALTPKVDYVEKGSAAEKAGIKKGDVIKEINGHNTASWDKAQIILYYKNNSKAYKFTVKHDNGKKETIKVVPDVTKDEEGNEIQTFGIAIKSYKVSNPLKAIGFGFAKFGALIDSFWATIAGLFTGKISLNSLSGPVGIYQIVGESFKMNIGDKVRYIMYLLAYLSINVGFINILPFPAFDGGHVLFLLIEKVLRRPVDSKVENTCHLIGFALILLLMIVVSINDIIKLF